MVLINGKIGNADDVVKNVISLTENMIQTTKLSADATVTDISRNNALVDVFSDSGGYNNTLNTGSSDAIYNSTNDVYGCKQNAGTPEGAVAKVGVGDTSSGDQTITLSILATGIITQVKHKGGDGGTVTIKKGAVTIATKTYSGDAGTNTCNITFADYSGVLKNGDTCTVRIQTNVNSHYDTGESFSGTNFSYSSQTIPDDDSGASFDWITFTPGGYTDSFIVTNSSTFGFNLASCLVNAETSTPTNTSITVDVSTDGGSTYDLTSQSLRTVLELDDDDTDLVLKFNLVTTDDTVTPTISSYGVQLFDT